MHQTLMILEQPRRTVRASGGSGSGSGSMGCFFIILIAGVVLYLIMKGRGDKQEVLGASHRPMGSGSLQPVTFACPYPKCPTCSGASDKMKQSWDGMRKVTWSCGYCGAVAGVQELKDEELPASARQRLGLDAPQMPAQGMQGYGPGYGPQGGGGGIGDMLTGMMIGNMMSGGGHHHHHDSGRSEGDGTWSDGSSSTNSDWGSGDSSSSDWGGDSGSSDSGGDWGGGDSGGDSGGSDW